MRSRSLSRSLGPVGYSWSSIVLAHLVGQQPPTNYFGCDGVSRCFAFSIVPTAATIFAQEGQHVWSFVVLTYDEKTKSFPDRDLDGKDDRAEGAATGGGVGAAIGGTAGLLAG